MLELVAPGGVEVVVDGIARNNLRFTPDFG
jgi:hypothetical protein